MTTPRTGFATAQPLRLADLGKFDCVEIRRPELTCLIDGPAVVLDDSEGDAFVECRKGRHYLEHMADGDGVLVGVSRSVRS